MIHITLLVCLAQFVQEPCKVVGQLAQVAVAVGSLCVESEGRGSTQVRERARRAEDKGRTVARECNGVGALPRSGLPPGPSAYKGDGKTWL